jgi:hypothetical protein
LIVLLGLYLHAVTFIFSHPFVPYVSDRADFEHLFIKLVRQLLREMYVLEPIADRMERSKLERKLQKQKPFFRQDETPEDD